MKSIFLFIFSCKIFCLDDFFLPMKILHSKLSEHYKDFGKAVAFAS